MINDTICAVSTPPGTGGIAVVRISGPDAIAVAQKLWKGKALDKVPTHTAHLGNITYADGTTLDQCVATVFRAPGTYTGEDVVELSVHGSPYVQRTLVSELCSSGARIAQPGEFTRRAFTAGHLDLMQAESVADILAARSQAAHRLAMSQLRGGTSRRIEDLRRKLIDLAAMLELELDFAEEDVEFADRHALINAAQEVVDHVNQLRDSYTTGAAIKDGIPVAIIGPTNAGKSSLLNALIGDDRAIVSDIHGTTRDIVEDTIVAGPYMLRIMDTAGLRHTTDTIEQAGIKRSLKAASQALVVIVVLDATDHTTRLKDILADIPAETHVIVAHNKSDLLPSLPSEHEPFTLQSISTPSPLTHIHTSTKTGEGIGQLLDKLTEIAQSITEVAGDTLISNLRQATALAEAAEHARQVPQGLRAALPTELVVQQLRLTIDALSTLTGTITSDLLLQTIFNRFCIGK